MTTISCPLPDKGGACIERQHGFGSRAMNDLIANEFKREFGESLQHTSDSAYLEIPKGYAAVLKTIDAHVVDPPFFPGGDIGALSVIGTVNDIVVSGGDPFFIAASFILTEGFPLADLRRIIASMAETARKIGVSIVTGDTKVLPKGTGCGIAITTSGTGFYPIGRRRVGNAHIQEGDKIIVTGELGMHFAAITGTRPEYGDMHIDVKSDMHSLHTEVAALFREDVAVHRMTDLTRGGLTTALCGISDDAHIRTLIYEEHIPINPAARVICEQWGFDPYSRANEGRMVLFVSNADEKRALDVLRNSGAPGAVTIGEVLEFRRLKGSVVMEMTSGARRKINMPSGEDVIRIC